MITIVGPTASGKTAFAANLAYHLSSEVISADSRQVYKGMDLGTGKDLADYQVEGLDIPYHLIDIRPAGTRYNLYEFQQDFHKALIDIRSRGIDFPILCGGTGLYVECVLKGYHLPKAPENKVLRERLSLLSLDELLSLLAKYGTRSTKKEVDTVQRAIRAIEIEEYKIQNGNNSEQSFTYEPVPSTIFCLDIDRDSRRRRISERLERRLSDGMIEEVERLLSSGIAPEALLYYGLEYKWITLYVMGQIDYQEMKTQLEIAIHQFAKRQMTWFRGMEKRGFIVHYIDALAPMSVKVAQALNIIGR